MAQTQAAADPRRDSGRNRGRVSGLDHHARRALAFSIAQGHGTDVAARRTLVPTVPTKKTNTKRGGKEKVGATMKKADNAASQLIDARIDELSDWRGEMLA